ncbi:hypothetical protein ACFVIM_30930, partial [Streptomyces sp. NPDC057638]
AVLPTAAAAGVAVGASVDPATGPGPAAGSFTPYGVGEPDTATAPARSGADGPPAYAEEQPPREDPGRGTPAEEAESAGPGTAQAVVGLLLAGAAAVAVALRGSRRRRGGVE